MIYRTCIYENLARIDEMMSGVFYSRVGALAASVACFLLSKQVSVSSPVAPIYGVIVGEASSWDGVERGRSKCRYPEDRG